MIVKVPILMYFRDTEKESHDNYLSELGISVKKEEEDIDNEGFFKMGILNTDEIVYVIPANDTQEEEEDKIIVHLKTTSQEENFLVIGLSVDEFFNLLTDGEETK